MASFKCLRVALSVEKDGQIRYEPGGRVGWLPGGSFWLNVERAIY